MGQARHRHAAAIQGDSPNITPTGAQAAGQGRLQELDALRGLAALAVVVYHFTRSFPSDPEFLRQPFFTAPWAKHGVEVFFVISGFVIFMTLSRTRRPLDFFVSRFARLYPAYWAAILFTTAMVQFLDVGHLQRSIYEVAVNFTMLQGLPLTGARDVDWSYWSLFTELLFYVVMLSLFATGQLKRIDVYLALALVTAIAYAAADAAIGDDSHWRLVAAADYLRPILSYFPYFVIGISLYRLWSHANPPMAAALLIAALATVAVTLSRWQFAAALIAVAAFALVLTGRASLLRARPLVWLGGISYSLYLVHNVAGRALLIRLQDAGWPPEAAFGAALLLAVLAAAIINTTVERPALRAIRDAHARGWDLRWQFSGFAGNPGAARRGRFWMLVLSIGGTGALLLLGFDVSRPA
jgi:peptidoglycan/LPS O-acetylase OafA/YrhL